MTNALLRLMFSTVAVLLTANTLTCTKDPVSSNEPKDYTGTISGVVNGMDGEPLAGVTVTIHADSATPGVSKKDGTFEVGRVSEGKHRLYFTHDDYDFDSSTMISVAKGEDVELDDPVQLNYAWYIFKGKILTKAGNEAEGAGVVLANTPYSTLADDDGVFVMDKIAKQSDYRLVCARSGDGFNVLSPVQGIENDTTVIPDIRLLLKGATVSGTVFDPDNKPVNKCAVSAISGVLSDTTSVNGSYTLRNIPSNEPAVTIIAREEDGMVGGIAGMELAEGGYAPSMDIYLREASDFKNGMAIETSDLLVADTTTALTLSVMGLSDGSVHIESYEWFIGEGEKADTVTALPFFRMSLSKISAMAPGEEDIEVEVRAKNDEDDYSDRQSFTISIRGIDPVITASVSVAPDSTAKDTLTIEMGNVAYLTAEVFAPFGGVDSMRWSFGDGTPSAVFTDSLVPIGHLYDSTATYRVVFIVWSGGNETVDTVVVKVNEPTIAAPICIWPENNETAGAAGDTIILSWHPVEVDDEEVTYNVYLDAQNTFPVVKIASDIDDTILAVAVEDGTTYYWSVEAVTDKAKARSTAWKFVAETGLGNTPPRFITTASEMNDSAWVGREYRDTIEAQDMESKVTYSLIDGAEGISVDSGKGILIWNPTRSDTGKNSVSVAAVDEKDAADTLTWIVTVIYAAPVIITHPEEQTVDENDSVVFSVSVSGEELTYQWQKDSVDIDNATDPVYAMDSVALADSGLYRCIATNAYGSDTSSEVRLIIKKVNHPPEFVSTPTTVKDTAYSGIPCIDTIQASDEDNDSLIFSFITRPEFDDISLTGNVLEYKPDVSDTGTHAIAIKVSDGNGGTDTLQWTMAVMVGVPVIVTHPIAKNIDEYQQITLLISARGEDLIYQWQKDSVDIDNADDSVYWKDSAALADSGLYRCIVSNGFGSDTSSEVLLTVDPVVASIIYVKADATGDNDGSNWTNAFTDLQAGIDAAPAHGQVWVAAGVYKPTKQQGGEGERFASFSLKTSVAVYGGFDGTESQLSQRDWEENVTVCSGDVGTEDDSTDNCFHVFYHTGEMAIDKWSVLDGFTITGGNADSILANTDNPYSCGGGMYNKASRPSVQNCIITQNSAFFGGGLYNTDGSGLTMAACTVGNNHASSFGGGMYNRMASAALVENCFILGNSAQLGGGGIYNDNSSPTILKSTVSGNSSSSYGGGIYNTYSSPVIDSSTISSSTSESYGGGMYCTSSSNPTVTNSLFSVNSGNGGGGIYFNTGCNSIIHNCTFFNNSATGSVAGGGGICNVLNSKIIITNSTFVSNSSSGNGGGCVFHRGGASADSIWIVNSTFSGNLANLEGGGIYFDYSGELKVDRIINCVFWNNGGGSGSNELYTGQEIPVVMKNCVIDGGFTDTMALISDIYTGDPELDGLLDNGGPVKTMALLDGSSALDKGVYVYMDNEKIFYNTDGGSSYLDFNDEAYTTIGSVAPLNTTDARGVARPKGGGIDLGAYEKE